MSKSRTEFEKRFPVPVGVEYNDALAQYEVRNNSGQSVHSHATAWLAWQSGRQYSQARIAKLEVAILRALSYLQTGIVKHDLRTAYYDDESNR